jgi:hypothetical protein
MAIELYFEWVSVVPPLTLLSSMLFEKSGEKLMKMILASVSFAALMASPVLAQSPRSEGLASRIYLNQQRQFGADNRAYMFAPRSNQDAMDKSLCSTAHDFCPGFHGDNG